MKKHDEVNDSDSCLSRARDDERIFVLLGRDESAPYAIRAWIVDRVRSGKNRPDDPMILEADECQRLMQAERDELRRSLSKGE